MARGGYASQAARRTPPQISGNTVTATSITAATSTAEVQVSAVAGVYATFRALTDTIYIVFGDTGMGAATTSNGYPIPANDSEEFFIPAGFTYFRAISSSNATIQWFISG